MDPNILKQIDELIAVVQEDNDQVLSIAKRNCSNLGGGIFKLPSMNQLVDPVFINLSARKLHRILVEQHGLRGTITKILTAPVSGVLPAFAMSMILNVPTIVARPTVSVTFSNQHEIFEAEYSSHTKRVKSKLLASAQYISANDRILIVDDVLATGNTATALMDICIKAKARVVGAGFIMEKCFEKGRDAMISWCRSTKTDTFPIACAVAIASMEDTPGGKIDFK